MNRFPGDAIGMKDVQMHMEVCLGKISCVRLLWWYSVKNLPANAGNMGSIPGPERFHTPRNNRAHEPQLLKPRCLEPILCNKTSATLSPQLEKAHALQRRPSAAKINPFT